MGFAAYTVFDAATSGWRGERVLYWFFRRYWGHGVRFGCLRGGWLPSAEAARDVRFIIRRAGTITGAVLKVLFGVIAKEITLEDDRRAIEVNVVIE